MMTSGLLLWRRRALGRTLFVAIWIATLLWAVWESGTNVWYLMPRVIAPTVLLAILYLPWISRALGDTRRVFTPARAGGAVAVGALVVAVLALANGEPSNAQGAVPESIAVPTVENGDWSAYGGTLAGLRHSTIADINPSNVAKLEQVWVHRVGDTIDYEEAVLGKRAFHHEATPIHIRDTLYTCNPHSYVQAIEATTGKMRWSWNVKADRKGNLPRLPWCKLLRGTCRHSLSPADLRRDLRRTNGGTRRRYRDRVPRLREGRLHRLARQHGLVWPGDADQYLASSGRERPSNYRRTHQ